MKLLVHTCCGPCSLTVHEGFRTQGFDVTGFFYNPNIHPYTEHKQRLDALKSLAEMIDSPNLIVSDKYDMEEFLRQVADNPSERCRHCYRMRLSETAKVAAADGFDAFSTTLSVSPYQNHEMIKDIGNEVGEAASVKFVYEDFRPTFRDGQQRAKELGLYRQKYCGCIYSEKDRFYKPKGKV